MRILHTDCYTGSEARRGIPGWVKITMGRDVDQYGPGGHVGYFFTTQISIAEKSKKNQKL